MSAEQDEAAVEVWFGSTWRAGRLVKRKGDGWCRVSVATSAGNRELTFSPREVRALTTTPTPAAEVGRREESGR